MLRFLLSPLAWCLLAATAAWLAGAARPRLRRLAGIAALASLALMTPWGAYLLAGALELRAASLAASCEGPPPQVIVVLGGGLARPAAGPDDLQALSPHSLRRVLAAWQLWLKHPDRKVVIAGGGPFQPPESTVMASLAHRLGVPLGHLSTETRSMNTAENLAGLAALQPPLDRRIWLVSSALHLPRAVAAARQAGFEPCAVPADFRGLPPTGLASLLPHSASLALAEDAIHEIVGAAWYAWFR